MRLCLVLFTSLHICSAYLNDLLEDSCPEACPSIPWDNITKQFEDHLIFTTANISSIRGHVSTVRDQLKEMQSLTMRKMVGMGSDLTTVKENGIESLDSLLNLFIKLKKNSRELTDMKVKKYHI